MHTKLVRIFACLLVVVIALGMVSPAASRPLLKLQADCAYGGQIKAVEAVDKMTVKFTFCYPDPAFPSKVAFSAFAVHSSEYLNKTGGTGDLISNPIGTGPYMLEKWDRGNEMVLTANPNYRGEAPKEKTVIFRWNSEAAARWNELQAGTIDGMDNPAPSDFGPISANPAVKLYPRASTNIFYLGINNTVKPFDNVKVRQAIAHAIDKQRIVDNFYPPASTVADQFMPKSIFGYTPDAKQREYNVETAKALLKESGVELPIKTTLSYRDVVRGYLPQPGVVAQDLQAQLKEVGIEVEITVMESGAFLDAATAGQLSLHLLGWGADYPDATNFLDYHFGKGASDQFGAKDQTITDLLSQAAQISDRDARLALYKQANDAIADFVPMVPIANGGSAVVFRATIEGAYAGAFSAEQFALMTNPDGDQIVWMQNGEPISLFCADETDGETLRACEQVSESLLGFVPGGGDVVPVLAKEYSANADLTEWTFKLVEGAKFSDGSEFDSEDVVTTWMMLWDAANPLHKGRTGVFDYFRSLFGAFLNEPK